MCIFNLGVKTGRALAFPIVAHFAILPKQPEKIINNIPNWDTIQKRSEILNGRRKLTLGMIKSLYKGLRISADILLA